MNACVVYFSRTGNTKRFAQAISEIVNAPIYDLISISSSVIQNCDLLILGTPVEGSSPAKETVTFIENLPTVTGKKTILFCTYRIFGNERTMKKIEKTLEGKGYKTLLKVSKKGMKPEIVADFSEQLSQVKKVLESLAVD
jgi:flavodoxin